MAFALFNSAPTISNAQNTASKPSLECKTGPVEHVIGGHLWIIYSCGDKKSVVFVSHKTNPAMPFYFIYRSVDGRYKLSGEGNGDKAATQPAFDELKTYDAAKLIEIIKETQLASKTLSLHPRQGK